MQFFRTSAAVMLISCLMPSPAWAAEFQFTVGDQLLTLPLPTGYCLPANRDKQIADLVAAGDTANVTHTMFIRCERAGNNKGPGNDYIIIKTPLSAVSAVVERDELLAELATEFGKANWQNGDVAKEIDKESEAGLSRVLGTSIAIEGEFGPRGADAECAYLGGSVNVSGAGVSYPVITGSCITSAAGKVVVVHTYDDPGKGGGVEGKMRFAKSIALTINKAP